MGLNDEQSSFSLHLYLQFSLLSFSHFLLSKSCFFFSDSATGSQVKSQHDNLKYSFAYDLFEFRRCCIVASAVVVSGGFIRKALITACAECHHWAVYKTISKTNACFHWSLSTDRRKQTDHQPTLTVMLAVS